MVRRASGTSAAPNRNMSSSAGLMMARAPGPSGSVTRSARPRTSATGTCRALPLTRSAAEAISSATAATVTSRMLPNVSGSPRWSRTGVTPAAPIALSVCPARQGRPIVSVTRTPTLPARALVQRLAQPPRGLVRVLGQQHHGPRGGVGLVHPGRGQHQAVPGLRDRGRAAPGHHPHRLRLDGLLPRGGDHPALGLAHDLGGDHEDVAVAQVRDRRRDQRRQVGARGDLRQPGDREHRNRRSCTHVSSRARSSAARAIAVVAGRSRISSGSARTSIPASAGSSPRMSTAALSWSSTSQPSISSGP